MDFAISSSITCMLFMLPFSAIAQTNNGRVDVGASLIATDEGSPWLSPSGDFAFGFHQHAGAFLVSIWFDKIPAKTVVWYAFDNGSPIIVPAGSKIELTAENGLVLLSPRGEQLWRSNIALNGAAYGVMNDTGNFAIQSRNSDVLWQSFDHPTDTLLPTQTIEMNGKLFSKRNENNFSLGKFQLSLQNDGNLVLSVVNLPSNLVYDVPFYESNTNDPANDSNSGDQLIFNGSGEVYVLRKNDGRFYVGAGSTLPTPQADFYQRVTLDSDGVLAQYYHPKRSTGEGNWSTVWSKPDDICSRVGDRGSGACGFNSICSLNENRRPTCTCPPGFSLLDPQDKHGSCKPDIELDCRQDGRISMDDLYDFTELLNTDWPGRINDYEKYQPYNEQDCITACLHDCMCVVALFGEDSCWKKKQPLINGRQDGRFNGKALIKITRRDRRPSSPNLPTPDEENNQGTLITTISILFGTSVFVNFALVGAICLGFFFIYKRKLSTICQVGLETNLQVFTYKELVGATNSFEEELGRGAFGIVYKGTIGVTNVAVKKLNRVIRDGDCDKEFETEINVIGQTHNKNLVRLLGFCKESEQRLLVYEFLSNGTLADYLFLGSTKPSWTQRTQIALSIARGILYLHEECNTQIIHCDIKPQNILLDDNYNARISDFGLSKLLMMDQTQTKTDIRGTKGYVAPEWFRNLPITAKVDVYSFGVLLLEIICCRRSVLVEENEDIDGDNSILTYWAYDCFREGTIDALIRDDVEAINNMKSLERLLMTAFWCIQEDPYLRPAMRKVTQMLEGVVQVPIPPNPSPFTTTTS